MENLKEIARYEVDIILTIKEVILNHYKKFKWNDYDTLIVKVLNIAQNSEVSDITGYFNFLQSFRDTKLPHNHEKSLISELCNIDAINFLLDELPEDEKNEIIK